MGKAKIGGIDDITAKFVEVTPGRSAYYEAGVKNPLEDWEANTVAAAAAYKAAVGAADIMRRFTGGAKKAGTAKWKRKAAEVGVDRFGPGVIASEADFKEGFEPFVAVIAGTEMPERKPRGDPANYKRSEAIGTALFKKRLALIGAGGAT
ncbi:hypothetical protein D4Q85_00065 [bacterium]|nr:MAG: hypothetical protein D4Q85_00065 [bacterium]